MSSKNQNKRNTYFLMTQSTIIKGEKSIPFYSTHSKSKNKKFSSSQKSKNFSARNKKYINSKINKNKYSGFIDLNKVSGSSHSFKKFNSEKNQKISPNENNRFSYYGIKPKTNDKNKTKNYNYEDYLTTNKSIGNKDNNKLNKNIYNSKLYTPFYELIENLSKKSNGKINQNNYISNNNFFNSNHIVEIDDSPIKDEFLNTNNEYDYLNNENYRSVKEKELDINKKNDLLVSRMRNKTMEIQANDLLYTPQEQIKESIMSKTMKCLNNIKNNYNYDYSKNEKNNLNCFYNKENYNTPNNFNEEYQNKNYKMFNKYANNKNITYHYHESKNNNNFNIRQYNNKFPEAKNYNNNSNDMKKNNNNYANKNKISLMINELNCSLNSNTKRNKENFESNIIPQRNSKLNNTINLAQLKQNKNLLSNETLLGGNKSSSNIGTKHFLKSILDENSTNKFINDFNYYSPLHQNKKYISFAEFGFNNPSTYREKENKQSPRTFFNIEKDENKLEKMLKTIPTHKNDKQMSKFTNTVINKLNNNNNSKNKKLSFREINNIMPPNKLVKEK